MWLSDIVDALMSLKLHCGLTQAQYYSLLNNSYAKREELKGSGNRELWEKQKEALDIARGVYYFGSYSGVWKYEGRVDKKKLKSLMSQRKDYLNYTTDALKNATLCDNEFKDLLGRYLV